jgi:hypothetical protein
MPCEQIQSSCAAPTNPPSVQWRRCNTLEKL